MIDIILALLLGYYYRKNKEREEIHQVEYQEEDQKITNVNYNGEQFGYYKQNESSGDLT